MIHALGWACRSCWHPRVMLWTLLPLVLAASAVAALGWYFWEPALDAISRFVDGFELSPYVARWLDALGARQLRSLIGPMVVVSLSVPAVILVTMLLVSLLVVPALARHVARQRFAGLAPQHGATGLRVVLRSLLCGGVALLALLLSVPLWLVPPFVVLLPLLIWGWLASRLFAYAALAQHASTQERRSLLHQHRWPLWGMGLVCGVLASLPSLIWSAGTPALVAAPLLGPVAVWLYISVFVWSALWFSHYLLQRLFEQRAKAASASGFSTAVPASPAGAAPMALPSHTSPQSPLKAD